MTESVPTPDAGRPRPGAARAAVVVPHTHWDREWYAPFETMRFHLVRFLDELVEVLEADPALPTFLLDGQVVILEDYLEIRPEQRGRVEALVRAGRLRPGPFYVQPDELHVSGEALVRNLLIGCQVARGFGWVMREGYLPDTFGHVHQLPQVLQGFGIRTFYAMRGVGADVDDVGSAFWWRAPDGSRVLVEWLSESYSNAAVLTGDPDAMSLHHGVLVSYDSAHELLERLARRSPSGVLLVLNGGDHLRVQSDVPRMVAALDRAAGVPVQLGGLEEFSALAASGPAPDLVLTGELRHGYRHDVFEGIGSTRTPMKALAERTEAHLTGVAERLDALATLADGHSCRPSLRHAWRELVKNHAHDSICGCSVDAVHREMETRLAAVRQVSDAVAADALARLAAASVPPPRDGVVDDGTLPLVVVNPSAHDRTGPVEVAVVPDLAAPLGQRRFGWVQGAGVEWAAWVLRAPDGSEVPFEVSTDAQVSVTDTLDRRKEVRYDRVRFTAEVVPALGTASYRLVPAPEVPAPDLPAPIPATGEGAAPRRLENGVLAVDVAADGTLTLTDLRTGTVADGLLELLDDGDRGDEYGFGPVPGDVPVSSTSTDWSVSTDPDGPGLLVRGALTVPAALTPDRGSRSAQTVDVPVRLRLRLLPGADRLDVELEVDNTALDHRVRLRFDSGRPGARLLTESAFGLVQRSAVQATAAWHEQPSGAFALRRFLVLEDEGAGLQVLTEGLHEATRPAPGVVDVTVLRAVGWLARTDHPLRPHKIGPELATPGAQCLGLQRFRLGLRLGAPTGPGSLYRAAEEFALPLLGHAVQGAAPAPRGSVALGLAVADPDVVLSAVKTAEDGDGVVVRVFNASDTAVTTTMTTRRSLVRAVPCDLEERALAPGVAQGSSVELVDDRTVALDLPGGRILSVRLRVGPASPFDDSGGPP